MKQIIALIVACAIHTNAQAMTICANGAVVAHISQCAPATAQSTGQGGSGNGAALALLGVALIVVLIKGQDRAPLDLTGRGKNATQLDKPQE